MRQTHGEKKRERRERERRTRKMEKESRGQKEESRGRNIKMSNVKCLMSASNKRR